MHAKSFGSLSTRLILVVVGIQALVIIALVWNSVRLINTGMTHLFEESVQAETRLLANSLAPGLAMDDRGILEDALLLLQDKKNLQYITVFNEQGAYMAGKNHEQHSFQHDTSYLSAISDNVYDIVVPVMLGGQTLGTAHVGYSIDIVENLVKSSREQNAAIGLSGLALSLFLTYLLSFFLTGNLRKLEFAAKALKNGEFDYRLGLRTNDEIGALATAFDQLAEHLKTTTSALEHEHLALLRESKFLQSLVNNINAVLMEANSADLQFTYVSHEAENLLGYTLGDWLLPGFFMEHLNEADKPNTLSMIKGNLATVREHFSLDFRMRHLNGHNVWVRMIITSEIDSNGVGKLRGLMLDITEQRSAEDRILYLAEHDSLTSLINRRRFQEELDRRVAYALRYQEVGALLFIDLDQFKYINDSYGHQYGDEFLIDVSRRLHVGLRKTDILGRLGGDEFGIIIPHTDAEQVQCVAKSLLEVLKEQTYNFNGMIHHASASIGIVLFPVQGHIANDLLAKADAAMYSAKNGGRAQYHLFDENDNELWNMQSKIHWEERIRWALCNNRFVLHYQPIAILQDFTVTHYEVLLRMQAQEGELIPPGAFLDTAERFGLISDIDRWVLVNAIKAQAGFREQGRQIALAINISGRHFGSDDIFNLVRESIDKYGADPTHIIFEVTETAAVENLTNARQFMESLQKIGCRFALDDFGIGFSSFHYLRNLPVDFVKIDGSFVRNLHLNREDRVFVKAMVDLAHGLGITCIAEFVENADIVDILKTLGVESGQGYYLARPSANPLAEDRLTIESATAPLQIVANR